MRKAVRKHHNIISTVLLLLLTFAVHAQVTTNKLQKRVLVFRNETRVDSFLHQLARQTGLGFSFNSKKINPGKLVPMQKGSYTLEECLLKIQQVSGLHYGLLNDHIILVDNPPQEKYRLVLSQKAPAPTVPKKKSTPPKPVVAKKVVTPTRHAKLVDTPKRQQPVIQKVDVDSVVVQTDSVGNDSTVQKDSTGRKGLFVRNRPTVHEDSTEHKGIFGRIGLFDRMGLFGQKDSTDRNDTTDRSDSTQTQTKNPKTNTVKKLPPSKKTTASSTQNTAATGSSRNNRSDRRVRIEQGTPSYGDNPINRHKNWNLIAGATLLRPDFADMKKGIGAQVQYEKPFSRKWSWTGSIGYNYIMGNYIGDSVYIDTLRKGPGETIKHIAHIPVLLGLRYYVFNPVYLSFETGYSFKTDVVAASCLTFSPALGVQIPVGHGAIDMNVNYLWLKEKMTIPEAPRFQKGGLGFWCLRLAYVF